MNSRLFFQQSRLREVIFESVFDTTKLSTGSSANNQVALPFSDMGVILIDWGDGTTGNSSTLTHTYSAPGIYNIKVKGTFSVAFDDAGDKLKILEIINWGQLKILTRAFKGCSNLNLKNTVGKPILQPTMSSVFHGCTSLTSVNNINNWDFSSVASTSYMFFGCSVYNQEVSLNTTNNTSLANMFDGCTLLNSPINLDFSNVINAEKFLNNCSNYNQNINWTMPKCTNMLGMFTGCTSLNPYNFYLSLPEVTNFSLPPSLGTMSSFYLSMPLISNVLSLFDNQINFNPTSFYLNINSATVLNSLFKKCQSFNPLNFELISTSATDCTSMFNTCTVFNKPLPLTFNTANVLTMEYMFVGCTAYNKDVASVLILNKNVRMGNMFTNATSMSPLFIANLYNLMSANLVGGRTQTIKAFAVSGKYDSSGSASRASLVADGWSLTDQGVI